MEVIMNLFKKILQQLLLVKSRIETKQFMSMQWLRQLHYNIYKKNRFQMEATEKVL